MITTKLSEHFLIMVDDVFFGFNGIKAKKEIIEDDNSIKITYFTKMETIQVIVELTEFAKEKLEEGVIKK